MIPKRPPPVAKCSALMIAGTMKIRRPSLRAARTGVWWKGPCISVLEFGPCFVNLQFRAGIYFDGFWENLQKLKMPKVNAEQRFAS